MCIYVYCVSKYIEIFNQGLTRRSEVEDINGKRMSAMTIFSMSINYMRTHLMSALRNAYPDIEPRDVMFVVTVPAIWNDASRQFMREAACQVSIYNAWLLKQVSFLFALSLSGNSCMF